MRVPADSLAQPLRRLNPIAQIAPIQPRSRLRTGLETKRDRYVAATSCALHFAATIGGLSDRSSDPFR